MIRTSSSVNSTKLDKCITTINANFAYICKCVNIGNRAVLELSCDFANETFEYLTSILLLWQVKYFFEYMSKSNLEVLNLSWNRLHLVTRSNSPKTFEDYKFYRDTTHGDFKMFIDISYLRNT